MTTEKIFKSFMMAGFESATQRNTEGKRNDMVAASHHDTEAALDYSLVRQMEFGTVRDGVRWHLIEAVPHQFDFSSLDAQLQAALDNDTQVIWNLMHYGWPDHLDVFADDFAPRFGAFARATAQYIRDKSIAMGKDDIPFYTPVNEMSYLAQSGGDLMTMFPYAAGRTLDLRVQFVKAAIAAMEAVWSVDPRARFVHVDPLIYVHTPRDQPHLADVSRYEYDYQFGGWDMLSGRSHPELGGRPEFLDIIGVNFYHVNNFEYPGTGSDSLLWHVRPRDDRWKRFCELAPVIYERYGRPFILSETSHFGVGRADWLQEITVDVLVMHKRNIPIKGICLYPIMDRHDWENHDHWHNSGLWDFERQPDGRYKRTMDREYAAQIRLSQFLFE